MYLCSKELRGPDDVDSAEAIDFASGFWPFARQLVSVSGVLPVADVNPTGDHTSHCGVLWQGRIDMTGTTFVAFAMVAFIGIATPGPTVLLALSNGSRFGMRRAIAGMLGAMLSDFVLIGAAALGLGALLAASEFWFTVVKWCGVAYLAFLGIMLLRSKGSLGTALNDTATYSETSSGAIFMRSFLVAATNPKGYLFFSAFLPQFVDPALPQLPQYAVLACVFAAIDFAVMLSYAGFGAQAAKFLRSSAALWLDRICGGALLALAGTMAFYRRSVN
jgi:threonine/homoserine/homoserine lactone efflux protein